MVGCSMDMKRKVLEEILADIDDKEGLKLKPKMAEEAMVAEEPVEPVEPGAVPDENEEMGDDDLKALLKSYLG